MKPPDSGSEGFAKRPVHGEAGGDPLPLLSVVVPCFNEAEMVERFHAALAPALAALPGLRCEVLYVDDGSTDGTLELLNALARSDPCVIPLSLSRNFGQATALSAGLDAARGDAVVLMDADLQHPPALIGEMVAAWRRGADVVSGVRRRTAGVTRFKDWSSAAFYWILNRVSATPIEPGTADFCLLARRVRDALVAMPEHHRFLRGLIAWVGFRRVFLPYDAPPRPAGRTKYGARKMLDLALDAIFAFSAAPMRAVAGLGLLIVALGLVFGSTVLVRFAAGAATAPGWASLICVALLIGGFQILIIGVLGEYLARVFEQTRGRPLYLLKQGRPEE